MPATTSRPTSALRAALAGLGLWLVTLTLANAFLYGRQATDQNLFVNPPSRAYVAAAVEGTLGDASAAVPAVPRYGPLAISPASRIEAGDLVVSIDNTSALGVSQARDLLRNKDEVNVVVLHPATPALHAVRVQAWTLSDALRSIGNTVLVIFVEPGGASDRAGMKPGDVLTRINGQGFSSSLEADGVMRQSGTDRETAYDVLRGGEAISLMVRLASFGVPLGAALLMLVGLAYMLAGVTLASLRAHIKAARFLGLAWMGTGVSLAMLLTRPGRGAPTWLQFTSDTFVVGGALFGMATWLHALHYFPRERTALIARRWVRPVAYALAGVGTAAVLAVSWDGPGGDPTVPAIVVFMLFMIAATRRTRAGYGAEEREMLRPLTRSTTTAVVTTLLVFAVGAARGPGAQAPLPVLATIAGVYLAMLGVHLYVIGRYRLLEADLRIRRNVQYLFVSTAWTMVVLACGFWLWWTLSVTHLPMPNVRMSGETIEVLQSPVSAERRAEFEKGVLIAAAAVLAFAFRALLKRGHRFLAEQYYQEGYDYRKASQELTEVMGSRVDLEGLADGVLTVIDRLMPAKKAGVAFVDGSRVFAARRSTGFSNEEWDVFCRSCIDDALAALGSVPAEFDSEYAPPRLRLALRRSDIHYLYPIRSHNQLRGLVFIGEKLSESAYTADDFAFLNVIAAQASLLVENAFLYENVAQQERARQELAIARRIQIESLPQQAPSVDGFDVAGMSTPALEVGGDYFDYLTGNEGVLGAMVGDVSGKGTSAALYMSKLQGIVRSLHSFSLGPSDLFIRTNDLLRRDLERRSFVTALGGFFDMHQREVVVARAGHLPLLRYEAATGQVHRHTPAGIGFGLTTTRQFVQELREERIPYFPGDVFLFVTDGITESHASNGEDYGEDRLAALLQASAGDGLTASDIVVRVKASVDAFTDDMEQHDDQTVVVVRTL